MTHPSPGSADTCPSHGRVRRPRRTSRDSAGSGGSTCGPPCLCGQPVTWSGGIRAPIDVGPGQRVHLGLAGAVAALGVGLLGACTGDTADPTTSTPTSSASSSSASPTNPATTPSPTSAYVPVKPKFPAAARKQTDAGAVAFAEYYWALVNYAYEKPDSSVLSTYRRPNCLGCEQFHDGVRSLEESRQQWAGPVVTLRKATHVFTNAQEVRVVTEVSTNSVELINSDGSVAKLQPKETQRWGMQLVWATGHWDLEGFGRS